MRAAQINSYGGKDVVLTTSSAPKPTAAAGEVLVAVHAAGVNPFDWKVREGYMQQWIPLAFPATLGGDCSGVIVAIGEDVEGFSVGQEVFGEANAVSGNGAFAEFAPIPAKTLALKPKDLDFTQAAALPLASASAYLVIVETLYVKAGQRILIHGGAGGIGSFAIQIAKHLGAYVATTAKGADAQYVKELGADEVIDYQTEKFDEKLHDFDAVFDTVGGDTYTRSFSVVKTGGAIASMVEQTNDELAKTHNVSAHHISSEATRDRLEHITELLEQGALKIHVDKTFPLEQAADALEYVKNGQHKGKVVITITG